MLSVFLVTFSLAAIAQKSKVPVGGLDFTIISDSTAEVAGFNEAGLATTDLIIPSEITNDGKVRKVISVGWLAFQLNENIETVFIPNTVKDFHESCFGVCSSLKTVTFEEGNDTVKYFSDGVFAKCSNLERINNMPTYFSRGIFYQTFGESPKLTGDVHFKYVERVFDFAFAKSSFTSITIDSTSYIDPGAFSSCPNLEMLSITAPSDSIFEFPRDCPNLKLLIWNVSEPSFPDPSKPNSRTYPWELKCVVNNCFLFVPKNSLNLYRQTWRYGEPDNEKAFKDILPLEDYYSGAYKNWDPSWIVPSDAIEDVMYERTSKKSHVFDLQGRRLEKTPAHGLYIQNGKKIVK